MIRTRVTNGLTDGSAGLHGQIFYTDRYAELKAFGAAALAGVAQGFQTVQGNYYGGDNLQTPPKIQAYKVCQT
jgi:hypothetical protein